MSDKLYLDSIQVESEGFRVNTAVDGSIMVSSGTGLGQRIVGLTPYECRLLHRVLSEYLHMRNMEGEDENGRLQG